MTETDLQKEAAQLILELHEAFGNSAFAIETDKVAQLSNRVHALAEKLKPKPALPPIPPGSKFFYLHEPSGDTFFRLPYPPPSDMSFSAISIINLHPKYWRIRFLIAAVAMEEWRLATNGPACLSNITQWREWRDRK